MTQQFLHRWDTFGAGLGLFCPGRPVNLLFPRLRPELRNNEVWMHVSSIGQKMADVTRTSIRGESIEQDDRIVSGLGPNQRVKGEKLSVSS